MLKRPFVAALIAIAVLATGLWNLPLWFSSPAKSILGAGFVPLFGLEHAGRELTDAAGNALAPRQTLVQERDQLRRENQALRVLVQEAADLQIENERLRAQAGFAARAPWKLRPAQVIGRDPSNWWRTLHIDAGANDGLRVNCPVLTPQGLVGRISQIHAERSVVRMVGDPECRVSALIQETRETTGILIPAEDLSDRGDLVTLTFLSRHAALKAGQNVITSGQGGLYPKGILVGRIVDWGLADQGLYQEARVQLAVRQHQLEEVWVILP